jgi:hypothetical protein
MSELVKGLKPAFTSTHSSPVFVFLPEGENNVPAVSSAIELTEVPLAIFAFLAFLSSWEPSLFAIPGGGALRRALVKRTRSARYAHRSKTSACPTSS